MESRNPSFVNSLQCLRHPLTVFAIVLLVLNDHVFKLLFPSWLTGKMSDFAGLFFFPFLLGMGLSLVLARFEISTGRIGLIAIALTGLWFFLLKTTELVNSLSAQGASVILGRPVAYVLDPSDVLALTMLLPAWLLWRKPKPITSLRFSWVVLFAAVLASLASSPVPPGMMPINANRFVYQDDVLYVVDKEKLLVAKSTDFGNSWEQDFAEEFAKSIDIQTIYPIQVCDPVASNVCYRTFWNGLLQMTPDGGASWQIVWSLPFRRLGVMERIAGEKINAGPTDLLIVQNKDNRLLFVALGDQGLLRRTLPDGVWESGILRAPTPAVEPDFHQASYIASWDWVKWEMVSLFTLLGLSWWLWNKSQRIVLHNISRKDVSFLGLAASIVLYFVVAGYLLYPAYMFINFVIFRSGFDARYHPGFAFVVCYLVPFLGLLFYIKRNSSQVFEKPRDAMMVTVLSAVSALGVLFFGVLPTILWIQGKIEQDFEAVLWMVLPLICIIPGWFFFVYRRSYRVSGVD